jgi:hypothetical protein
MKTLTKTGELRKKAFQLMLPALLLSALSVSAQITETVGTVGGTTSIASHETANGFDNDALTYSGTGDVRVTTASTGYTGASGGANVFLRTGKNFVMSNLGTNACGGSALTMSFGVFKSTNAENGSSLVVEYSTDGGINWNALSFAALPTGSGTSRWYLRSVSGLPATCNLKVRFSNTAPGSIPDFRIDDIVTSCGSPVESLCTAVITANDTNVFCAGDSVRLTANSGDSYVWSNGATTQSILVVNSGTYFVTVENSCCFATSAGSYVLVHNDGNPNPVIGASVDNDTVCVGDSVTLSARTFARDLFISQYQEGAGNDKAVEIFNGTGHSILLSDYEIRDFHNGACDNIAPTFTIALPAIFLADGDVYVVANASHSDLIGVDADQTSADLQFNGDDAVTLFNVPNDAYVDIIGSICNDPGAAWTAPNFYRTEDRTLTRKPCVYEGIFINPNLPGTSGFPTLVSEWNVDTLASVTGFGSHTMDASLYAWTPQPTVPASGSVVRAAVTTTTNFVVEGTYCDGCPFTDTVRVVVNCEGGRLADPNATTVDVKAEAYPNPFTDIMTLNVNTPENGLVRVEILNMLGETVAVLNNSSLPAGSHTFTWNGSASNGVALANGVYSCKVTTGNVVKTIMLVKSAN